MTGTRVIVVAAASLVLLVALTPGKAWAPVPPRDCGMLEAGERRFNIKADQIRCRTARRYARQYLLYKQRPRGFSCRSYGRETRIRFRCSRGAKVVFAIRR